MPVLGWTPDNSAGDEVEIPSYSFLVFPSSSNGRHAPATPPSEISSPVESIIADDEYIELDGQCRKGSAGWVPRPRNKFMIFRCEFAKRDDLKQCRSHTGPGRRMTVSKLAAEAWKRISKEDKEHYHILALEEKDQHAKDHPNYIYRPLRKQGHHRQPRHPAHNPSFPRIRRAPIKTSPETENKSLALTHSDLPPTNPVSTLDSPLVNDTSSRHPISSCIPSTSDCLPKPIPLTTRTLESHIPHPQNYFDYFQTSSSNNELYHTPTVAPNCVPSQYVPPAAAVASSLANWNGESQSPPALSPTLSSSTTSSLLSAYEHALRSCSPYMSPVEPHYSQNSYFSDRHQKSAWASSHCDAEQRPLCTPQYYHTDEFQSTESLPTVYNCQGYALDDVALQGDQTELCGQWTTNIF